MRRSVAKHKAQIVGRSDFVHDLHGAARVSYVQWREANRPREGALFDEMNKSRRLFKIALRRCRQNRTRIESDKLASAILKKDSKEFWTGVKRKHAADKTANINEIDNVCGANNIVNVWKEKYVSIYNRGDFSCDKERLSTRLNDDCDNNVNDMVVSNSAVISVLDKLQVGRAVGSDGISAELLKMYSAEAGIYWLCVFNMFLHFGYSPCKLLEVKLYPIPKDKNGDLNNSDNYRCIAISSCISKLFELVLREYIQGIVELSDCQFGFRRNHSTNIAHALLKKVASGFRYRGSYTFLRFLDMSKAFDYVNCWKLFNKLLDKGVARNVVNLLFYWYANEAMFVQWQNYFSDKFSKCNGVRQGSPLSPFLFSLYIDNLLRGLHKCGVGCKLFSVWANVLGFVDDIVLLAPSWAALQKLIDLALEEAIKIDMVLNSKKTKCMVIKPKYACQQFLDNIISFKINGIELDFCNEFKYLGQWLVNDLSDVKDMKREMRAL